MINPPKLVSDKWIVEEPRPLHHTSIFIDYYGIIAYFEDHEKVIDSFPEMPILSRLGKRPNLYIYVELS